MPNAILLHGTDGNDKDYFWFGDTQSYLTRSGYDVWWPALPRTDNPRLDETISFLETGSSRIAADTILIGHSSACPVILSLLQRTTVSIKQAILVAGFYKPLPKLESSRLVLQDSYDWPLIRSRAGEIILINSDDDPWECTVDAAAECGDNLSAISITHHGQGHMGSHTYNQPYREFDLLKRLIKF